MWRRRRPQELATRERWPDGDTVVPDGHARWVDLLDTGAAVGRASVPEVTDAPLMTRAAQWRSRGRRRTWI